VALPRRSGRARYRLALLVLTGLTLLTLDFRGFGPLATAQSTVRDVLAPIRSGVLTVISPVTDAVDGALDRGDLEDENARLRAELEELQGDALRGDAASDELEALKEQLDLPSISGVEVEVARVTVGPAGNFEEHVIEIDKGSSSGLREGMAVMTAGGLVGKLVQVDGNRSVMQLVTAPDFAVGVIVGGELALARGTGSDSEMRAREGLSQGNPAKDGDPVQTSGGTSTFPAGVPIGRVAEIAVDGGAPVVTIELAADIANLDYVSVLLYPAATG
jgi:rod shape-determining protein MreC